MVRLKSFTGSSCIHVIEFLEISLKQNDLDPRSWTTPLCPCGLDLGSTGSTTIKPSKRNSILPKNIDKSVLVSKPVAIKVFFKFMHLCCFLKSKTDTGCHRDWLLYHFCRCAHPAAAESNMLIAVCVTVSAFFVCSHLPVNKMSNNAANVFLFCL